ASSRPAPQRERGDRGRAVWTNVYSLLSFLSTHSSVPGVFFHLPFSEAITSCTTQKGPDRGHRFIIPVAADIVTSARNMHHLTMLPEVCRFLGSFGRDNRT